MSEHAALSSGDGAAGRDAPGGAGARERPRRDWSGAIAGFLILALVGWMASGMLFATEEPAPPPPRSAVSAPVAVEAARSQARTITRTLTIEGEVEPDLATPVRAEAGGTVAEVLVARGARVEAGDTFVRIAPAEREAQLAQAEADLRRARRDFDSITGLAERGFATRAREEEVRAALAAAEARLAAAREALDDTLVRAPVAGIMAELNVDRGEVVQPGEELARIIDTDPLVVDVRVPQRSVAQLETGQRATVEFVTGQVREGRVRYIAANAAAATRTFEVEVEVPNPGNEIPAGISAEVALPVAEVAAHFVSPAILALGEDGTLGVKTVTDEAEVAFYPVELVKAETGGIWIAGLPDEATVITVGQGFVSAGEAVTVRMSDAVPEPPQPAEPAEPAAPVEDGEPAATEAARSTPVAPQGALAPPDRPGAVRAGADEPAAGPRLALASRGGGANRVEAGRDASATPPAVAEDESGPREADAGPAPTAAAPAPEEPPAADLRRPAADAAPAGAAPDPAPAPGATEAVADPDRVGRVQSALQALGYDVGPVDGIYGRRTAAAIRRYQDDEGLPATGTIGPDLLAALDLDTE